MWVLVYDNKYKIYKNDSVGFQLYMFEYTDNSRSYLRYSKDSQYIGLIIRKYKYERI